MTNEQIIEGNKLIAIFMAAKYNERLDLVYLEGKPSMYSINELKYHTSWDWLMPVVEKIEGIGDYHVSIGMFSCYVSEGVFIDEWVHIESDSDSKIKAVWLAVIEFIKWHNQNTNQ
jgi:hypothetical protein